jgi:DNA-binding NtrC family response regulator
MAERFSILVVDDEAPLLKLMQSYLARLGYEVTGAANATEALESFRADPGKYSLVVADLTLPDMKGDQMALEMAAENTALKVLLCSGYIIDVDSLPESVRTRFSVLQKPFLPAMLAKEVEALLQRS